MKATPLVSVIIPVYNAAKDLSRCLLAIRRSSYDFYEIIVVSDGSNDGSPEVARKYGAFVLKLQSQSGPAAARNYGAEKAKGEIFLFVDSDVLIQQATIRRVVKDFEEYPYIGALFGSYDDDPLEKNFFSQYMNLRHHFVHQTSSQEAVTFWTGCGAVNKEAFQSIGGFDKNKYSKPSIEDIELGFRLKKMGYRILLDKDLQVRHLKKWTFISLLRVDIFSRAIPWTKLILESREMVNDLNLQISQKICTGLLGLSIILIPLAIFFPELVYLIFCLFVSISIINHRLIRFFLKRKSLNFTIAAFAMFLLYYAYSGATYALYWLIYKIRNVMHLTSRV